MKAAKNIKVLIACELSGIVRDQFLRRGFDAISCDLEPTERKGPHIQDDIAAILNDGVWDLMIGHPPCTYLANSGNKHLYIESGREEKAQEAAKFFKSLLNAPIKHIAIENPIMRRAIERVGRKQDQIIQPTQFGHMERKATCLWLKNLPNLKPISDLESVTRALPIKDQQKVFYASPGKDRAKLRSYTYHGIAWAMAEQWGNYLLLEEAA